MSSTAPVRDGVGLRARDRSFWKGGMTGASPFSACFRATGASAPCPMPIRNTSDKYLCYHETYAIRSGSSPEFLRNIGKFWPYVHHKKFWRIFTTFSHTNSYEFYLPWGAESSLKKLTDLVFEYDDVIHHISTTTLNSWHNIPNYKFAKLKGTVYVSKCESKYMANKVLAERLDACEHNIALLQKCIAAMLPAD